MEVAIGYTEIQQGSPYLQVGIGFHGFCIQQLVLPLGEPGKIYKPALVAELQPLVGKLCRPGLDGRLFGYQETMLVIGAGCFLLSFQVNGYLLELVLIRFKQRLVLPLLNIYRGELQDGKTQLKTGSNIGPVQAQPCALSIPPDGFMPDPRE